MEPLHHTDSTVVARSPEDVYAMVSDVTRMGEWSPVCKECWWDDEHATGVGAWFTGRNVGPERTWETHCEIAVAEPGREFAFVVSVNHVRWGYTFAPVDGGTRVTESWDLGPESLDFYKGRLGDEAPDFVLKMQGEARASIATTLATLKARAESGV